MPTRTRQSTLPSLFSQLQYVAVTVSEEFSESRILSLRLRVRTHQDQLGPMESRDNSTRKIRFSHASTSSRTFYHHLRVFKLVIHVTKQCDRRMTSLSRNCHRQHPDDGERSLISHRSHAINPINGRLFHAQPWALTASRPTQSLEALSLRLDHLQSARVRQRRLCLLHQSPPRHHFRE